MTKLTYPYFYYPDIVQALTLLIDQGIADERMSEAIDTIIKKQGNDGFWRLQRQYNERKPGDIFPVHIDFGDKGEISEWITTRALYVIKKWYENTNELVRTH